MKMFLIIRCIKCGFHVGTCLSFYNSPASFCNCAICWFILLLDLFLKTDSDSDILLQDFSFFMMVEGHIKIPHSMIHFDNGTLSFSHYGPKIVVIGLSYKNGIEPELVSHVALPYTHCIPKKLFGQRTNYKSCLKH